MIAGFGAAPLAVADTVPTGDRVRAMVLDELGAYLSTDSGALSALHSHALRPAGKLLRPLLVVQSALAVGGSAHPVLPAALGLELLHVGSLVHDDIIDGDTERRGRPAVHQRFGTDRAIVGADALFVQPFALLAACRQRGVPDERIVAATQLLAEAGRQLCQGAMLELDQAGTFPTTPDEYFRMAGLKTSPLLSGACRIGATLAGASPASTAALGRYGHALGLAFQARDDLLPYDTPHEAAGKPADSDLANQRPTLPVLLAHRLADARDRRLLERLLAEGARGSDTRARTDAVLRRTGAFDAAHALIEEQVHECGRALSELAPGPAVTALATLAEGLRDRPVPPTTAPLR
ncbi:polyprenyl synthetase family protein [Streptomyces sp. NPDC008150]|uniref:polyprenyl synthetase family protein n=1 Tax=Streptomyces sp. NPDC008150 TaxID=3364816 RepID=UPI0036E3E865